MSEPIGKRCYSIPEAMAEIGISRTTIYEEINHGRLRTFRVGRHRMISADAIREWIKDREAETSRGAEA